MTEKLSQYRNLILISAAILLIFIVRTLLARDFDPPRLSDIFTTITLIGCLGLLITGYRLLQTADWIAALVLGLVVGAGMYFATLFSPYPVFGVIRDNFSQAIFRGASTLLAALGGLVVMRRGGPVQFHAANRSWKKLGVGLLVGLALGVPFAVLNVFGLQLMGGQPVDWQNPFAALLDALQPGIVEEVVYRFAFLGLVWLALRKSLPQRAGLIAGILALVVHNYMHFDDLFLQAPLIALGYGLVLALVWGLPPTLLALRRGLESAVAFHWVQDVARFVAGF
jgi:hypothetical protein